MTKYKASDMSFRQVLNYNSYNPEKRNYTHYALIYAAPCGTSATLSVNVEEGIVFLEKDSKLNELFESEKELNLFIKRAQEKFDTDVDMGAKRSSFVFGYGGKMECLKEYDNKNIEYIPIILPDNEKFQNPRYKEKVQWSLLNDGAVFISPINGGEKYLAVIQRKNKPRNLSKFSRYISVKEEKTEKVNNNLKKILVPAWLSSKIGINEKGDSEIEVSIEKETEKALFISYKNEKHWLPKSKIKIV